VKVSRRRGGGGGVSGYLCDLLLNTHTHTYVIYIIYSIIIIIIIIIIYRGALATAEQYKSERDGTRVKHVKNAVCCKSRTRAGAPRRPNPVGAIGGPPPVYVSPVVRSQPPPLAYAHTEKRTRAPMTFFSEITVTNAMHNNIYTIQ